jgi:hypothetical protein
VVAWIPWVVGWPAIDKNLALTGGWFRAANR